MSEESVRHRAILLVITAVAYLGLICFRYYFWAFFLLIVSTIFILSRNKPKEEIALLLMVFFLPWMNDRGYGPMEIGFTIYPNYIFAILAGAILIVKKIKKKESFGVKTPLDPFLIAFLVILGISIIQTRFIPSGMAGIVEGSTVSILNKKPYLRSIAGFFSILFMVYIYYLIITICRDEKMWKQMLITLFISATLISIYGLFGFLTYSSGITKPSLYLMKLFGWPPAHWRYNLGYLRLQSLFCEPLIFGAYLVTVLPLELVLLFKKTFWIKRKWLIIMIIPQVLALIFTFSRSAWLGILAALSVILLYYFNRLIRFVVAYKYKIIILLLIVCVVFTAVLLKYERLRNFSLQVISPTKERFLTVFNIGPYLISNLEKKYWETPEQWSAACRINDIIAGLRMFLAHPFLGVGWNNYIFHYRQYDLHLAEWDWLEGRPVSMAINNLPMGVLAETGIFGFIIFIGIIYTFILTIAKAIKKAASEWQVLLVGYLAAFIGIFVCYQFFSNFYFSFVWAMFGMGMVTRRLALEKIE